MRWKHPTCVVFPAVVESPGGVWVMLLQCVSACLVCVCMSLNYRVVGPGVGRGEYSFKSMYVLRK